MLQMAWHVAVQGRAGERPILWGILLLLFIKWDIGVG